jgi:chromate reductase, NAD(P)H dehydrogenase (quinone)
MRVLGISGSLRRDSHNTTLLRAAGEIVEEQGAEFEVFDGLKTVPPYDEDDDVGSGPAGVARLRGALAGADAVLFSTPEYNSSIPGVLKNAVDWASRPLATNALRNKPVAVIGASTGMFGAVWAQAELRKVLGATGARVAEVELALGHAHEHLDAAGRLSNPTQEEALSDSVRVLLRELENAVVAADRTSVVSRGRAILSHGLTRADPHDFSRAWRNGHPALPSVRTSVR